MAEKDYQSAQDYRIGMLVKLSNAIRDRVGMDKYEHPRRAHVEAMAKLSIEICPNHTDFAIIKNTFARSADAFPTEQELIDICNPEKAKAHIAAIRAMTAYQEQTPARTRTTTSDAVLGLDMDDDPFV